uniref:Minor capsid protein n=1 Tax=Thaumetopoea pityocampa cypovirus 5 TaxID=1591445 RepID=A0A0B4UDJ1_9REOV|nr:minor capsid protein [Thaumetopoea pityocampa cypovirus 5]
MNYSREQLHETIRNESIKYIKGLQRQNRNTITNEQNKLDNEIREWFINNRGLNEIARKIAWTEKAQELMVACEAKNFENYEMQFRNDFSKDEYEGYIEQLGDDLKFDMGMLLIRYQIFELVPNIELKGVGSYTHEYTLNWKTHENVIVTIRMEIEYEILEVDEEENKLVKVHGLTVWCKGETSEEETRTHIDIENESQHIEISIRKLVYVDVMTATAGSTEIENMPIELVTVMDNGTLRVKADIYLHNDVKEKIIKMEAEEIFIVTDDCVELNKENDIHRSLLDMTRTALTIRLSMDLFSISTNLPDIENALQLQLVTKETIMEYLRRLSTRTQIMEIFMTSMWNELENERDRIRIEDIMDYLDVVRERWIAEGLDMSGEAEQYLARMTFSNTARIDELFDTVPRYVEQTLEIKSIVSGQFYDRYMLIPLISGEVTITSPFRRNGYNEINTTYAVDGVNNPVPYNMRINYNGTIPTSGNVEGRFEVYSQGSFKILVDGSYTMGTADVTNDEMDRINFTQTLSRSHYGTDLHAGRVGTMLNTSHVGYIPVPVYNTTYTLRINNIYILDSRGIDVPLIDKTSGKISIYTIEAETGNIRERKLDLEQGSSTLVIIDGIRYAGMVFNVDYSSSNKLFNEPEEYMYYVYNSGVPWTISRSSRIITQNENITNVEITANARLNEEWENRQGMTWRQDSVWRVEEYHGIRPVTYIRMQNLTAQISTDGRNIGNATGLYVTNNKFNRMQLGPNHNGTSYRWDTFMARQPTGIVVQGVNPFRLLSAFIIALDDINIEYRIPMPPVSVGIVRIYDGSVRDMQLALESMELDMQRLSEELNDIRDRLTYVEAQIKSIIGNDDMWSNIIGAVMSIIMDIGLTIALGGLGYAASALIKGGVGAMKVAMGTLSKSKKIFEGLKRQISKGVTTPIEAINKHTFSHVSVREAKYKSVRWDKIPTNLDAEQNLRLDDNFRYSMLLPEFSMGTRNVAYTRRRNDVKLLMNVPDDYSGPVSKIGIHYQPLKIGGLSKLSQNLFNKIKFDKLDAQYMYRANKLKSRKPAHAWSSIESFEQDGSGNMIRSLTVFGVGEHGGMNANSMSGKIDGITFKEKVNRRDGNDRIIAELLSPSESGYTDQEVREMFYKRFKIPGEALTVGECWSMLHKKVSTSVLNSKTAHEFTFASPYMHKVIEDIIKNPPTSSYNLWSRNCQHLVNDINRYIKGYPINDAWGLEMNRRIDSIIYKGMSRTLDLIDSSVTLLGNIWRVKEKKKENKAYMFNLKRGRVLNT